MVSVAIGVEDRGEQTVLSSGGIQAWLAW